LRTHRGIPFDDMFDMTEYPEEVMPLYSQGHSLAKFLISQHGKRKFLAFLADGLEDGNWPRAVQMHYGHRHLLALQNSWMDWIRQGRPDLSPPKDNVLVASHTAPLRPISKPVVRGQDPGAKSVYSAAESSQVIPTSKASQEWPVDNASRGSFYDASRATGTTRR
jgi:hypothetical protein